MLSQVIETHRIEFKQINKIMKQIKLSDSTFEPREGYERSILLTSNDFGVNTKLQLMRLAPGQSIKPHHHNIRTECFRIVSGSGQIKINGEIVAETDNDVVLCERGDVHEFVNTSATEPLTFLVIRTNDPGNEDMIWEEA
ncbi:MAG: cupin domain-containing protein [bacterium]|nr:cupin domain-containing protein [bacterium]